MSEENKFEFQKPYINPTILAAMTDLERLIGRLEVLVGRLQQENADLRKNLQALSDGVNRRCGQDINQLPLVSLDKLLKDQRQVEEILRDCLLTIGRGGLPAATKLAEQGSVLEVAKNVADRLMEWED